MPKVCKWPDHEFDVDNPHIPVDAPQFLYYICKKCKTAVSKEFFEKKIKQMKRERGFYWVKFSDMWIVAHYEPGEKNPFWSSDMLDGNIYNESIFSEINETRILNPDEVPALAVYMPDGSISTKIFPDDIGCDPFGKRIGDPYLDKKFDY